jgi:O-antigen ligase
MNRLLFFLFIILSIIFTPNFGALDRATVQWFFLSIVPLIYFRLIFFKNVTNFIYILYCLFIVQVFLSLFYSNNISISIIDFSRHLSLFLLFVILINYFKSAKFSFLSISAIIAFFLLVESIISLLPLFSYIFKNGFSFSNISSVDLNQFKGITGNRNITTASIVIKFPFLFYYLFRSKNLFKPFISILSLLPLLSLFIINSRAALLSFFFSIILYTLYFIIYKRTKFQNALYLYLSIAISYFFSYLILPSKSLQTAQRLSSITLTNDSSSQRFFLWQNAFSYISENLFIGCGIGNWKVESAAYWGSLGSSYLVPYHAHNDFLEFATELGIFGGLTYLIIFIAVLFTYFKLFLIQKDFKFLVLFLSFTAVFVDSFLNFPFERPIIMTMFVLLLALAVQFNSHKIDEKI